MYWVLPICLCLFVLVLPAESTSWDYILRQPIEGGELFLARGISPQWYYPSGHEGKIGSGMAEGCLQARKIMSADKADEAHWVIMLLHLEDGVSLTIDRNTRIILECDSLIVASMAVVLMDGIRERRAWDSRQQTLRLHNGHCPYGRTEGSGYYMMYVRFPPVILSDKGDDIERRFDCEPKSLDIVREVRMR